MALATQCPHCRTTFRVAHDQLKLRSGMVRCGSCQHIFNGIEQLVVAENSPVTTSAFSQQTPATNAQTAPEFVTGTLTAQPGAEPAPPKEQPASDSLDFALEPFGLESPTIVAETAIVAASTSVGVESPAPEPDANLHHEESESSLTPSSIAHETTPDEVTAKAEAKAEIGNQSAGDLNVATEELSSPVLAEEQEPTEIGAHEAEDDFQESKFVEGTEDDFEESDFAEEPEFVKRGRQQQQRARTMRIAMGASIFFLSISLLLQGTYTFRSIIAAWHPPSKPILTSACKLIGCYVGLPTQIDALTIEPNDRALLTLDKNKTIYEFNVLLRNHSSLPQAWPHIELTLNNTGGKPVLRKIFRPQDFPFPAKELAKGIAPNSEQSVRLLFKLSQLKASGYAVQVFYP